MSEFSEKNRETNIVFVSAFMNVYMDKPEINDRGVAWRIRHFTQLAKNHLPMIIFCSPEFVPQLTQVLDETGNTTTHLETLDLKETDIWKQIESIENLQLPHVRNETKDTKEYIALMHCKPEFLRRVIDMHVQKQNITHYAWIDFNIYHIFNPTDTVYADRLLQNMVHREFQKEEFIAIPGCWPNQHIHLDAICNHICWRFCGGFYIGTKNALLEMNELYEREFVNFLRVSGRITWEVNFWAFLEYEKGWSPTWYDADHNERMLEICPDVCCCTLISSASYASASASYASASASYASASASAYDYPIIPGYTPSTTSHISLLENCKEKTYKHVLNTRFVNYTICDNGAYCIQDPHGNLKTQNMFVVLDDVHQIPKREDWIHIHMEEDSQLVSYSDSICGLEDIRLFHNNESKIHFVASNRNYQPDHKIRIMMGEYDISNREYRNMRRLDPPTDTYCEKNWIPLPDVSILRNSILRKYQKIRNMQFIYRWAPFEIGELDENNKLRIVQTIEHKTPYFRGVRGSSCFVYSNRDNAWIAVVHFSEERLPRHYYHMLVLLDYDFDTNRFVLVKYSNFFCFNKKSIEFCTGFTIDESVNVASDITNTDEYIFWISNFDRDPECIKVKRDHIPFHYSF